MTDEQKRMLEGLFKAIEAETDGYHFYKMAAENTKDSQGKEVFEALAQEELTHKNYLTTQYQALLKTGKLSPDANLGKPQKFAGEHPIFSDEIKKRASQAHYEMSALSIAIQLEQGAMQFYMREAAAVSDADAKKFYTELAQWEQGHFEALLTQQNALRQEYWAGGGFAPF